jgi:glycine cleavage system transcriptional repressor
MTSLAITVVGHDRPGIIAQAAEVLSGCGMNLEDSSMTLLRGHFAMTLICAGDADTAAVEAALQPLVNGSLDVTVREVPEEPDLPPRLSGTLYVLLAEVDIPRSTDIEALQAHLAEVSAELGVDCTMRLLENDQL